MARPLVIQPVDDSQRVQLRGSAPIDVRPELDRGLVDDSLQLDGLQLQLRRSPDHEREAETLAEELHRAGSPVFHQWLTASEFAERFGVAQQDITQITDWLERAGFTAVSADPSRMSVHFSGTAGQVRHTFRTEIHALDVHGVRHIANVHEVEIPAAFAPVVEGIVSLNDFRPRAMVSLHRPLYTSPGYGGPPFYGVAPADLAKIYRFNPLFAAGITGTGQTIAVVEDADLYNPADWTTFRRTFGLDAYGHGSLKSVHPGGCGDPGLNPDGDDIESAVDVEWASAAAPGADIVMAACASTATTYGPLIAAQNLLNQRDVPPIINVSYAACEAQNGAAGNASVRDLYQQAALEGVSIFVAAGDNGSAMCDLGPTTPAVGGIEVNALASTVYDVAVGGTDFGDYYEGTTANYWSSTNSASDGSALGYVPEIAWNDTCASTLISSYFGYSSPVAFCATNPSILDLPYGGAGGPSNCAIGDSPTGFAGSSCRGWPKPAWQRVLGNPADGVRDVPDIAMFSADGVWDHAYVFCNSDPSTGAPCVGAPDVTGGAWSFLGGTSFAAPIMAGMQALVNEVWGGRQGNPAPMYYAIARRAYGNEGRPECGSFATGGPAPTCTFNDIATGNNDMPCIGTDDCYLPMGGTGVLSLSDDAYEPAFVSGVGWDFTTGIGSVNAANLVLDPTWLSGSED